VLALLLAAGRHASAYREKPSLSRGGSRPGYDSGKRQHRRILHTNVTAHPSAEWTGNQVVQAFPYDSAPRFLLRDNDRIYDEEFSSRVTHMGIDEVTTACRSPWQNAYVRRVIGSIRRECLDHMIIFGENHLRHILAEYVGYYNNARTHQSLGRNSPTPRDVEPP